MGRDTDRSGYAASRSSRGIPLGLAIAAGRTGRNAPARALCARLCELRAGVPVVTFVMLIFFGLPRPGLALGSASGCGHCPHAQYCRVQQRDLAGGHCRLPTRPTRGRSSIWHDRPGSFRRIVFPQIWRTSLPITRQRDDAAYQGEPCDRDHRCGRSYPQSAADRRNRPMSRCRRSLPQLCSTASHCIPQSSLPAT